MHHERLSAALAAVVSTLAACAEAPSDERVAWANSPVSLAEQMKPGFITTIAGGDGVGDGPALSAIFHGPRMIGVDGAGSVFVPDAVQHRLRKVSGGMVSTVAGTGTPGFSGDGGPAHLAQLNGPTGATADALGNIFVADALNGRVRRIDSAGNITTIAGGGETDPAPLVQATNAKFLAVRDVAVDSEDRVYFTGDSNNSLGLFRIELDGTVTPFVVPAASVWGSVYARPDGALMVPDPLTSPEKYPGFLAGASESPSTAPDLTGVTVDPQDNVYVADRQHQRILKYSPAGDPVAVYSAGTACVSQSTSICNQSNFCYQYHSFCLGIETVRPRDILANPDGSLLVTDEQKGILTVDTTGAATPFYSGVHAPWGLARSAAGHLVFTESSWPTGLGPVPRVLEMAPSGAVTPFAGSNGDGGPAIHDTLVRVNAVAVDPSSGDIAVTDESWNQAAHERIAVINHAGIIQTARALKRAVAVAFDPLGRLYYLPYGGTCKVYRVESSVADSVVAGTTCGFSGDGGPATLAQFNSISDIAFDAAGAMYIADANNNRVRRIGVDGIVQTIAGNGAWPTYVHPVGYTAEGDGGPAVDATIGAWRVALDGAGNLFIGGADRVRKVSPDGIIVTYAGNGSSGRTGDGGLATAAAVDGISALAVDSSGRLYISARYSHRVRQVDELGIIDTIAGGGTTLDGDGGPATAALLNQPAGIAVRDDLLLVAEAGTGRIRAVKLD